MGTKYISRSDFRCKHRHTGKSHPKCYEEAMSEIVRLSIPDLEIKEYTDYPRINPENGLVDLWFDPHCPYHDVNFCNEAIQSALDRGVETIVIGGDFMDFKGLYKKDKQTITISWLEELKIAVKFIKVLASHFEVYLIMGNHDWRLVRFLESNIEVKLLYDMIFDNPKVHFSPYFYALINDWLFIVHPDKMRKTKLSLVEELCVHHRKSVIMGHSHRFAFGTHDNGEDILGEGLTMTQPKAHEYTGLKLTAYSAWVQGYWRIEGDKVTPVVRHKRIINP